jgi:hypothetical protein
LDLRIASQRDVIVVGGGTAGVAAAVAAGRNGVNVLLIERYGFLGGSMTAGLVNPFMRFHAGKDQIIRGIFQEMIDRLRDMSGYDEKTQAFDVEAMKLVTDQMVKEAGVDLLLHTCVISALVEGNVIRGVEAYNVSGRQVILGKVMVDATGDGDVAAMAGAPYEKGRREDGLTQPMTLNFRMGGVDVERMPTRDEINRLYRDSKGRGEVTIPREDVLWFPTTRKGEIHFNTTRIIRVDGTKAEDLTRAEVEGRRQMAEMAKFLKEKVPGFEGAYLSSSGTEIGIRESRRIIGEYVITGDDIVEARKFEDVIARGSYPIDIHNPTGEGTVNPPMPPGASYDRPYRAVVPKDIENLLVAGRCISSTHEGQSAIRVIPIAVAVGQAVGVAAALSAMSNIVPRRLDVSSLQRTLRDQGANLG